MVLVSSHSQDGSALDGTWHSPNQPKYITQGDSQYKTPYQSPSLQVTGGRGPYALPGGRPQIRLYSIPKEYRQAQNNLSLVSTFCDTRVW